MANRRNLIFRESSDDSFVGADLKRTYHYQGFDVCNANIYVGVANAINERSFDVTISVSNPRFERDARRLYDSLSLAIPSQ